MSIIDYFKIKVKNIENYVYISYNKMTMHILKFRWKEKRNESWISRSRRLRFLKDESWRNHWCPGGNNRKAVYKNSETSDNMDKGISFSCKLWIYYALTWNLPNFPNETPREKFLSKLKDDLKDNDSDYYFLVINKKNLSDIILTSLKWLESLVPNWNNLPFQCTRNNNRNYIKRNFDSVKSFILTTFWDSIQKRANIFLLFDKLFHEYLR